FSPPQRGEGARRADETPATALRRGGPPKTKICVVPGVARLSRRACRSTRALLGRGCRAPERCIRSVIAERCRKVLESAHNLGPPPKLPAQSRAGDLCVDPPETAFLFSEQGHATEAVGQLAPHPAFGHLLPRCGGGEGRDCVGGVQASPKVPPLG